MPGAQEAASIPGSIARALIRSLMRGTGISSVVRFLHVGHSRWLAVQYELLSELAIDGHSDTKFVRGAYGAGKSHFLSVVQDRARSDNWMTTHVECKADGVQVDRFETLYSKLVTKLTADRFISVEAPNRGPNVLRELLDIWSDSLLRKVGVHLGAATRPFDAQERAYAELNRGLLRTNLPPEFARALATYVRATLDDDHDARWMVTAWLQGADGPFKLPEHYVSKPSVGARRSGSTFELKAIGPGTAREVMRGILWLIKATGFKGLVLCIDEIEEIAKLGNRTSAGSGTSSAPRFRR